MGPATRRCRPDLTEGLSWPSYYLFLPRGTITVLIESPFASAATERYAQSSKKQEKLLVCLSSWTATCVAVTSVVSLTYKYDDTFAFQKHFDQHIFTKAISIHFSQEHPKIYK